MPLVLLGFLTGTLASCSVQDAEQHFANAEAYASENNGDAAIIELKNALKKSPDFVKARALLAELEFSSGNYRAAEADFGRAIEALDALEALDVQGKSTVHSPQMQELLAARMLCRIRLQQAAGVLSELTDLQASKAGFKLSASQQALLGLARLALDDLELAEAELTEALAIDGSQALAHFGLAQIAWRQGATATAREHFERATAFNTRDPDILLGKAEFEFTHGNYDSARTTYDLARALPGNDLPARLGLIRVLVFEKDYAAANAELDAVLQLSPDLLPAQYLQALVAYEQGDLDTAQTKLRGVLSGQSNYPPALYLLGAVQFQTKDFLQAEANLTSYLTRNSSDASARKLLGAVRMQSGNYDGVVAALEGTLEGSDDAQSLAMLGTAYARLNRLNEASMLLDKAVAVAPDVGSLRNQLAVTLLAAGESEQAIGQLKSAIKLDGELQLSDYLLVLAQLREGRVDEALEAVNVLRERAPQDPMGENLLGAVRFAQGDAGAARAAFGAALEMNAAFQPAALNLVRLELSEGNKDAAIVGLQALLDADSNNESALLQLAELELDDFRQTSFALAPSNPVSAAAERAQAVERAEALLRRAVSAHANSLAPRLALARLGLFNRDAALATSESAKALALAPANPGVLGVRIESLLLAGKRTEIAKPLAQLATLVRGSQPMRPQQLLTLARLYERSGDRLKAAGIYNELSSAEGAASAVTDNAHLALANLALLEGEIAQAQSSLDSVGDTQRASVRFRLLSADVSRARGELSAAQQVYEDRLAAGNRDALFRLSALHTQANRPDVARKILTDWVTQHPEDAGAEVALATSSLSGGDFADAQLRFEQALVQTPDNVVVLNNLAWLYQQTGDSRARETAERAWSLAPDSADVGDTYGWILVTSGEPERGRAVLLKAHELAPKNPAIAFHAASALSQTGRTEQALALLQDIGESQLAAFPESDAALALLRELVAIDQVEAEAE